MEDYFTYYNVILGCAAVPVYMYNTAQYVTVLFTFCTNPRVFYDPSYFYLSYRFLPSFTSWFL